MPFGVAKIKEEEKVEESQSKPDVVKKEKKSTPKEKDSTKKNKMVKTPESEQPSATLTIPIPNELANRLNELEFKVNTRITQLEQQINSRPVLPEQIPIPEPKKFKLYSPIQVRRWIKKCFNIGSVSNSELDTIKKIEKHIPNYNELDDEEKAMLKVMIRTIKENTDLEDFLEIEGKMNKMNISEKDIGKEE